MNRCFSLLVACLWVAFVAPLLAADRDPIRTKLDKAKAAFETEMEKYRAAVGESLDKLEQTARRKGDKKVLDEIAAARWALKEKGALPESIPDGVKSRLSLKVSLAQANLETAYGIAIRAYTKSKQDSEATATQKELDEFKAGALVVAASGKDANVTLAEQQLINDVAAMRAEQQVDAVAKKLQQLNPGFDGKVLPAQIQEGVVKEFGFLTDNVTDISPVRALVGLNGLVCGGSSGGGKGKLLDLLPLQGLPLTSLNFNYSQVSDLSPLKGMNLTTLYCNNTWISDLSPLKGMPLETLACSNTQVSDLSPLNGMRLKVLWCVDLQISNLSPLRGMPLTNLNFNDCRKVSDLSPLKGMPLISLACFRTPVSDLSPLAGMQLISLNCSDTQVSDLSPLLGCKGLKTLNITKTKVTARGVAALQKALPNCKIEWDGTTDSAPPKP